MPRPKQCRRVRLSPNCTYFKPAGVPTSTLEEIILSVDELEAMRLVDLEGYYHDAASDQMGVSRRTFGRIIEAARKKVTEALIQGLALRIEGGPIEIAEMRTFRCGECQHDWKLSFGAARPDDCPRCRCTNIQRAVEGLGPGCSEDGATAIGDGGPAQGADVTADQAVRPENRRCRQRRRGGCSS